MEFKPLLRLAHLDDAPEVSRAPATICRQSFELLDAKMSRAKPANQERRDSPQATQTEDQAGASHPVRRAPLPVHARRSARNPPCHHAPIQTLDHSEGLADQGAEAAKIGRARSL